jgi:hypothetical protein
MRKPAARRIERKRRGIVKERLGYPGREARGGGGGQTYPVARNDCRVNRASGNGGTKFSFKPVEFGKVVEDATSEQAAAKDTDSAQQPEKKSDPIREA